MREREKVWENVRGLMWQRKTNSGTFVCLLGALDTGICVVALVLGPKRERIRFSRVACVMCVIIKHSLTPKGNYRERERERDTRSSCPFFFAMCKLMPESLMGLTQRAMRTMRARTMFNFRFSQVCVEGVGGEGVLTHVSHVAYNAL